MTLINFKLEILVFSETCRRVLILLFPHICKPYIVIDHIIFSSSTLLKKMKSEGTHSDVIYILYFLVLNLLLPMFPSDFEKTIHFVK